MSKAMRANLLLLLTAMIWGVAFVAQDVASDTLGAFTFCGLRMALSALALLPVIAFRRRGAQAARTRMDAAHRRVLIRGGICCGVMLFLASGAQQLGISLGTGAGKAGFLTAMYIVLVPVLGLVLLHKPVRWLVWLAVALSVVGLYLLCIQEGFSVEPGDLLLLLCALCFSGHILVVDHFSPLADGVMLSCIQFAVVSVLAMLVAVFTEPITWEAVRACAVPILYAGIMSGAVGYTLQIVAQKDTDPTVASLLMSLESVFAVLAGWVLLGDMMSLREILGCVAMMSAILLAQLGDRETAGEKAR